MKVSVQGCGRWGTFIAWYLDSIGHETLLWGREASSHLKQLKETRKNSFLSLPESVQITDSLRAAVEHSDVSIVSISAQEIRSHLKSLSLEAVDGKTLVLCMKGIEASTGLRLTEVAREILGKRVKTAVWIGPGHVQDFVRGVPNCMVIDAEEDSLKESLVSHFSSELIRFYYGSDIIGSEVGAAAKNVIGIASGILDGLGLTALKGALMARGAREISRLIKAMGGNELTAYGLTHLGDYEATVFSQHSQNRRFGEALVRGEEFTSLAEGVATSTALMLLQEKYGTELPICTAVYDIAVNGKDAKEAITNLFLRTIKGEFA
ncbi:MAG: NAD(P)H-dependent glycerol-3-phosphate dehydrogenase [Eubacteriaceae bacterium]|jgi:glycerol-3-phosphate dehydrogenase (NAD(P)+)|nr:NAD(P)H-dependent glycerol-3-phosphate dehydrogenase [Eubacteriaceae bacterium]